MQNGLQKFDAHLPIGSLEAYLTYVNQVPMLSQEEEHALATQLQANNDVTSAKKMILSHLRYVARVAKSYSGYGLPLADLIQEGNVGLMKAVRRYDPNKGARLVTFAMHWIKAEIHEYILRNWKIVKIATTKAQRKLFFNLRNMKKRLGWMTQQEVEDVANDLGVKPETVRDMELRLSSQDASFDGQDSDDDDYHPSPSAYLEDLRFSPSVEFESNEASSRSNTALHKAIKQLDTRSQDILQARWLTEDNKATLHDLASKYDISAERVRQLEKNAMKKLKVAIETQ